MSSGEKIVYGVEEVEYATTVKHAEPRETSLFEDFYETLHNINKSCDKILEKLEKGKEQG